MQPKRRPVTTIQSRVNGLKIAVPNDARGVVGFFRTRGDNENVFRQDKMPKPGKQPDVVTIESEVPDKKGSNENTPPTEEELA